VAERSRTNRSPATCYRHRAVFKEKATVSKNFQGSHNHYNPNEPRDQFGRWTSGGSSWRDNPLRDPSAVGRADLLLGHARLGARQKGFIREFVLPTREEGTSVTTVLGHRLRYFVRRVMVY
jgi:hypothetical protein